MEPTTRAGGPDTPRNAMSLLSRRVTATTTVLLLVFAGAAWISVVAQARGMTGMILGLGQVGTSMPNPMTAPLFMGMWLTMMVAMMFPTVAPIVMAHRHVVQRRGEGVLPTVAFILGYLVVWTAIGLIPLVAFLGFRNLGMDRSSTWVALLSGGILVVAGTYQFTPLKTICLRACRNPLSFVLQHDFSRGARGAFRAGIIHGAYCLGCCWALMSVLVVVGLMNLVWMAGLTLVFLAEKNWRRGVALSRVAGAALALLGVLVVLRPGILPTLSG
jgi:predicted metal-binding membrane protein